jgi:hypothetical protein
VKLGKVGEGNVEDGVCIGCDVASGVRVLQRVDLEAAVIARSSAVLGLLATSNQNDAPATHP